MTRTLTLGQLTSAKHTTIEQEMVDLASKMLVDKSIVADLTAIPLVSANVDVLSKKSIWQGI